MSRPNLAEGGVPDVNTLATESKEKRKTKAKAAAGRFPLLSGFSDTGGSAGHCSWRPMRSSAYPRGVYRVLALYHFQTDV